MRKRSPDAGLPFSGERAARDRVKKSHDLVRRKVIGLHVPVGLHLSISLLTLKPQFFVCNIYS
jgi:hypothetical protein